VHRLMSVHELTFLQCRQSRGPQKNFRMEEWPWAAADKDSRFFARPSWTRDSHPRSSARNTGLSILGLLPSNDLIRLQFESSIGICVPNLVPDGAPSSLLWPQVEAGGLELRSPTWAPRSLFWRPPASRGRPWGKVEPGASRLPPSGDGRELTTIRLAD